MMLVFIMRGTAGDIIPPVVNTADHDRMFRITFGFYINDITNRNRIGRGKAFHLQYSFSPRIKRFTGVIFNHVPASG
jgi:hypothetical protein